MPLLSLIPSHEIANRLLKIVHEILSPLGLKDSNLAQEIVYVALIFAIALATAKILQYAGILLTDRIVLLHKHKWGRTMLQMHTLKKCSHIVSPLVLLIFLPFAFSSSTDSAAFTILYRMCLVYLLITIGIAIDATIQLCRVTVIETHNTHHIPIRGVINVCRGATWMIISIIAISVILDKSPVTLLAGLGAFSAALLLIFRDSILGFTAGLQLSENDMVRVGDWIKVPGTDADGTVMDVTLTVVKVRNWDNTVAMLPPHTLVSTSFINYRGMYDLGARRFVRPIYVDPQSVITTDPDFLQTLTEKYPLIKPTADEATACGMSTSAPPLQSGMATNLGAFRAYAFAYLKAHPHVAQNQTILVRLMEEEEFGIPVQIYCFTNTTEWISFEQIHNQIMEHFLVSAADFKLSLSNYSNYVNAITFSGPAPAETSPKPIEATK